MKSNRKIRFSARLKFSSEAGGGERQRVLLSIHIDILMDNDEASGFLIKQTMHMFTNGIWIEENSQGVSWISGIDRSMCAKIVRSIRTFAGATGFGEC